MVVDTIFLLFISKPCNGQSPFSLLGLWLCIESWNFYNLTFITINDLCHMHVNGPREKDSFDLKV